MNLAILAFFHDFQRFTSGLHTLGPWVKFLISVLGTVLNTFKNIKFDLKKVLRSHFGIFYWGPILKQMINQHVLTASFTT